MLDLAFILVCIVLVLGFYPVPPTNWYLVGLSITAFTLSLFCILYHCHKEDSNKVHTEDKKEV